MQIAPSQGSGRDGGKARSCSMWVWMGLGLTAGGTRPPPAGVSCVGIRRMGGVGMVVVSAMHRTCGAARSAGRPAAPLRSFSTHTSAICAHYREQHHIMHVIFK